MKKLILLITVVVGFKAFANTNSDQVLSYSCIVTTADTNPAHSSGSAKLYTEIVAGSDDSLPGEPTSNLIPVPERKATLVLEGILFTGTADLRLIHFKSDDGQVTASISEDTKSLVLKMRNQVVTYSQCRPNLVD